MKKIIKQQYGFSAVELLITLFIAAIFLMTGYQLYATVIKDGGEARLQARANNIAYDYLQRYKSSAPISCTAPSTLLPSTDTNTTDLSGATVSVSLSCPYSAMTSISKISATVNYSANGVAKSVTTATFVQAK